MKPTYEQLEQQLAAVVAENAGLKSGPQGFFAYSSVAGYEEFATEKEAMEFAKDEISDFRDQAHCDGWSDEVGSVVWGVVMQRATMTGLRDITEEDCCAPDIEQICDYALLPLTETPATDAHLAEVRAQARNEGINYAASRLAAAYNHGFIGKSMSEVADVVHMILDAKADLANDPIPAADGLSGEYAENSLIEFAAQLRQGAEHE